MARRYRTEFANKDGWTRWVTPVMRGYLMVCCDCSLVHEVQFKALGDVRQTTQGRFSSKLIKGGRIAMRVRRRNGLTKQARKS